ncbi:MAG: hypothetical protein WBA91_01000, partial [Paracoccaceae bacterium]
SYLALCLLLLGGPVLAGPSPDYPQKASFIVQLSSSQYASGFGAYLVEPLTKAFRKTGLRYEGSPKADYAATIETGADVGRWYGEGDSALWLYERYVTVGLSPADADIEKAGKVSPSFSVTVRLKTPNEDRVDELNCLIALATAELAARYQPKGHVTVNGESCARR